MNSRGRKKTLEGTPSTITVSSYDVYCEFVNGLKKVGFNSATLKAKNPFEDFAFSTGRYSLGFFQNFLENIVRKSNRLSSQFKDRQRNNQIFANQSEKRNPGTETDIGQIETAFDFIDDQNTKENVKCMYKALCKTSSQIKRCLDVIGVGKDEDANRDFAADLLDQVFRFMEEKNIIAGEMEKNEDKYVDSKVKNILKQKSLMLNRVNMEKLESAVKKNAMHADHERFSAENAEKNEDKGVAEGGGAGAQKSVVYEMMVEKERRVKEEKRVQKIRVLNRRQQNSFASVFQSMDGGNSAAGTDFSGESKPKNVEDIRNFFVSVKAATKEVPPSPDANLDKASKELAKQEEEGIIARNNLFARQAVLYVLEQNAGFDGERRKPSVAFTQYTDLSSGKQVLNKDIKSRLGSPQRPQSTKTRPIETIKFDDLKKALSDVFSDSQFLELKKDFDSLDANQAKSEEEKLNEVVRLMKDEITKLNPKVQKLVNSENQQEREKLADQARRPMFASAYVAEEDDSLEKMKKRKEIESAVRKSEKLIADLKVIAKNLYSEGISLCGLFGDPNLASKVEEKINSLDSKKKAVEGNLEKHGDELLDAAKSADALVKGYKEFAYATLCDIGVGEMFAIPKPFDNLSEFSQKIRGIFSLNNAQNIPWLFSAFRNSGKVENFKTLIAKMKVASEAKNGKVFNVKSDGEVEPKQIEDRSTISEAIVSSLEEFCKNFDKGLDGKGSCVSFFKKMIDKEVVLASEDYDFDKLQKNRLKLSDVRYKNPKPDIGKEYVSSFPEGVADLAFGRLCDAHHALAITEKHSPRSRCFTLKEWMRPAVLNLSTSDGVEKAASELEKIMSQPSSPEEKRVALDLLGEGVSELMSIIGKEGPNEDIDVFKAQVKKGVDEFAKEVGGDPGIYWFGPEKRWSDPNSFKGIKGVVKSAERCKSEMTGVTDAGVVFKGMSAPSCTSPDGYTSAEKFKLHKDIKARSSSLKQAILKKKESFKKAGKPIEDNLSQAIDSLKEVADSDKQKEMVKKAMASIALSCKVVDESKKTQGQGKESDDKDSSKLSLIKKELRVWNEILKGNLKQIDEGVFDAFFKACSGSEEMEEGFLDRVLVNKKNRNPDNELNPEDKTHRCAGILFLMRAQNFLFKAIEKEIGAVKAPKIEAFDVFKHGLKQKAKMLQLAGEYRAMSLMPVAHFCSKKESDKFNHVVSGLQDKYDEFEKALESLDEKKVWKVKVKDATSKLEDLKKDTELALNELCLFLESETDKESGGKLDEERRCFRVFKEDFSKGCLLDIDRTIAAGFENMDTQYRHYGMGTLPFFTEKGSSKEEFDLNVLKNPISKSQVASYKATVGAHKFLNQLQTNLKQKKFKIKVGGVEVEKTAEEFFEDLKSSEDGDFAKIFKIPDGEDVLAEKSKALKCLNDAGTLDGEDFGLTFSGQKCNDIAALGIKSFNDIMNNMTKSPGSSYMSDSTRAKCVDYMSSCAAVDADLVKSVESFCKVDEYGKSKDLPETGLGVNPWMSMLHNDKALEFQLEKINKRIATLEEKLKLNRFERKFVGEDGILRSQAYNLYMMYTDQRMRDKDLLEEPYRSFVCSDARPDGLHSNFGLWMTAGLEDKSRVDGLGHLKETESFQCGAAEPGMISQDSKNAAKKIFLQKNGIEFVGSPLEESSEASGDKVGGLKEEEVECSVENGQESIPVKVSLKSVKDGDKAVLSGERLKALKDLLGSIQTNFRGSTANQLDIESKIKSVSGALEEMEHAAELQQLINKQLCSGYDMSKVIDKATKNFIYMLYRYGEGDQLQKLASDLVAAYNAKIEGTTEEETKDSKQKRLEGIKLAMLKILEEGSIQILGLQKKEKDSIIELIKDEGRTSQLPDKIIQNLVLCSNAGNEKVKEVIDTLNQVKDKINPSLQSVDGVVVRSNLNNAIKTYGSWFAGSESKEPNIDRNPDFIDAVGKKLLSLTDNNSKDPLKNKVALDLKLDAPYSNANLEKWEMELVVKNPPERSTVHNFNEELKSCMLALNNIGADLFGKKAADHCDEYFDDKDWTKRLPYKEILDAWLKERNRAQDASKINESNLDPTSLTKSFYSDEKINSNPRGEEESFVVGVREIIRNMPEIALTRHFALESPVIGRLVKVKEDKKMKKKSDLNYPKFVIKLPKEDDIKGIDQAEIIRQIVIVARSIPDGQEKERIIDSMKGLCVKVTFSNSPDEWNDIPVEDLIKKEDFSPEEDTVFFKNPRHFSSSEAEEKDAILKAIIDGSHRAGLSFEQRHLLFGMGLGMSDDGFDPTNLQKEVMKDFGIDPKNLMLKDCIDLVDEEVAQDLKDAILDAQKEDNNIRDWHKNLEKVRHNIERFLKDIEHKFQNIANYCNILSECIDPAALMQSHENGAFSDYIATVAFENIESSAKELAKNISQVRSIVCKRDADQKRIVVDRGVKIGIQSIPEMLLTANDIMTRFGEAWENRYGADFVSSDGQSRLEALGDGIVGCLNRSVNTSVEERLNEFSANKNNLLKSFDLKEKLDWIRDGNGRKCVLKKVSDKDALIGQFLYWDGSKNLAVSLTEEGLEEHIDRKSKLPESKSESEVRNEGLYLAGKTPHERAEKIAERISDASNFMREQLKAIGGSVKSPEDLLKLNDEARKNGYGDFLHLHRVVNASFDFFKFLRSADKYLKEIERDHEESDTSSKQAILARELVLSRAIDLFDRSVEIGNVKDSNGVELKDVASFSYERSRFLNENGEIDALDFVESVWQEVGSQEVEIKSGEEGTELNPEAWDLTAIGTTSVSDKFKDKRMNPVVAPRLVGSLPINRVQMATDKTYEKALEKVFNELNIPDSEKKEYKAALRKTFPMDWQELLMQNKYGRHAGRVTLSAKLCESLLRMSSWSQTVIDQQKSKDQILKTIRSKNAKACHMYDMKCAMGCVTSSTIGESMSSTGAKLDSMIKESREKGSEVCAMDLPIQQSLKKYDKNERGGIVVSPSRLRAEVVEGIWGSNIPDEGLRNIEKTHCMLKEEDQGSFVTNLFKEFPGVVDFKIPICVDQSKNKGSVFWILKISKVNDLAKVEIISQTQQDLDLNKKRNARGQSKDSSMLIIPLPCGKLNPKKLKYSFIDENFRFSETFGVVQQNPDGDKKKQLDFLDGSKISCPVDFSKTNEQCLMASQMDRMRKKIKEIKNKKKDAAQEAEEGITINGQFDLERLLLHEIRERSTKYEGNPPYGSAAKSAGLSSDDIKGMVVNQSKICGDSLLVYSHATLCYWGKKSMQIVPDVQHLAQTLKFSSLIELMYGRMHGDDVKMMDGALGGSVTGDKARDWSKARHVQEGWGVNAVMAYSSESEKEEQGKVFIAGINQLVEQRSEVEKCLFNFKLKKGESVFDALLIKMENLCKSDRNPEIKTLWNQILSCVPYDTGCTYEINDPYRDNQKYAAKVMLLLFDRSKKMAENKEINASKIGGMMFSEMLFERDDKSIKEEGKKGGVKKKAMMMPSISYLPHAEIVQTIRDKKLLAATFMRDGKTTYLEKCRNTGDDVNHEVDKSPMVKEYCCEQTNSKKSSQQVAKNSGTVFLSGNDQKAMQFVAVSTLCSSLTKTAEIRLADAEKKASQGTFKRIVAKAALDAKRPQKTISRSFRHFSVTNKGEFPYVRQNRGFMFDRKMRRKYYSDWSRESDRKKQNRAQNGTPRGNYSTSDDRLLGVALRKTLEKEKMLVCREKLIHEEGAHSLPNIKSDLVPTTTSPMADSVMMSQMCIAFDDDEQDLKLGALEFGRVGMPRIFVDKDNNILMFNIAYRNHVDKDDPNNGIYSATTKKRLGLNVCYDVSDGKYFSFNKKARPGGGTIITFQPTKEVVKFLPEPLRDEIKKANGILEIQSIKQLMYVLRHVQKPKIDIEGKGVKDFIKEKYGYDILVQTPEADLFPKDPTDFEKLEYSRFINNASDGLDGAGLMVVDEEKWEEFKSAFNESELEVCAKNARMVSCKKTIDRVDADELNPDIKRLPFSANPEAESISYEEQDEFYPEFREHPGKDSIKPVASANYEEQPQMPSRSKSQIGFTPASLVKIVREKTKGDGDLNKEYASDFTSAQSLRVLRQNIRPLKEKDLLSKRPQTSHHGRSNRATDGQEASGFMKRRLSADSQVFAASLAERLDIAQASQQRPSMIRREKTMHGDELRSAQWAPTPSKEDRAKVGLKSTRPASGKLKSDMRRPKSPNKKAKSGITHKASKNLKTCI